MGPFLNADDEIRIERRWLRCLFRPLISDVGRRVTEGERAAGTSAQQVASQARRKAARLRFGRST